MPRYTSPILTLYMATLERLKRLYHSFVAVPSEKKLSRNKTLSSRLLAKEQTFTTDESIVSARPSTSDINRQSNHIFDYAPRTNTDDSTIVRETGRTYSRFNTLGRDILVRFKPLFANKTRPDIHIQHAFNGREIEILGRKVDGYCELTREILEFDGCFFHGCTCLSNHDVTITGTKELTELLECTLLRDRALRAAVYTEAALPLDTVNVPIATYVTTGARIQLYSYLRHLGGSCLYCDTDSIISVIRPTDTYTIPTVTDGSIPSIRLECGRLRQMQIRRPDIENIIKWNLLVQKLCPAKSDVIVDFQGLKDEDNTFIIKECSVLAICGSVIHHWTFKSPYSFSKLPRHIQKQCDWLAHNHNGLQWDDGDMNGESETTHKIPIAGPQVLSRRPVDRGRRKVKRKRTLVRRQPVPPRFLSDEVTYESALIKDSPEKEGWVEGE
uniref:DNA-directed DNA polymerase n=1 Tax=Timema tahoe TaxID=61484 RepID=A0A7R9IRN0_9NEOP|nr:unnamed protein product [Timema tahoe]